MQSFTNLVSNRKPAVMYLCRDLQETNWARLEHFLSGEEEEPRLQLEKTWCNPADPRSTGTVI